MYKHLLSKPHPILKGNYTDLLSFVHHLGLVFLFEIRVGLFFNRAVSLSTLR